MAFDHEPLEPAAETTRDTHGSGPGGGRAGKVVAAVLALAVVAAAGWYLWPRSSAPPPSATEATAPPATSPPPELPDRTEEPLELPALGESDELIRQLLRQLSQHPRLAAVLATPELVRRFVVSADNVAEGQSPARHWPALVPAHGFATVERGGRRVIAAESFHRYDPWTELFARLDPAETARLYRQLLPLFEEAYRELGYPQGDFDATLGRALEHLLAAPVVERDLAVVPKVQSFAFDDPALEALSDAQKLLLRAGAENARRIQRQLRALRAAGVGAGPAR
jgi:hypothetical protein